ncbi:PREDICTED: uncharacterized protein LOC104599165 [Nelumbo nucifera]|uniref:Uncharacterized protein LOC104599165 n=1 Tax=Nelumbo nucifera TaxID=4432 RepID=A0A1U8ACJ7_NELNU|nr:PREDICTED: uncharacterized protein LOC104599165 [Nelumbo nucifera]
MGCSNSKLDNEKAVQLCKDRKRFIKQAVEQRIRFASVHVAYLQSLKRVSDALHNYVEGYESLDFLLDSYTTPPLTPTKNIGPDIISVSSKSLSTSPIQSETNSFFKVNCLKSGGNPSVYVEERPPSPEMVRIESYSPMHRFGIDGFFTMKSSPMNSSPSFISSSPNNGSSFPPPSPQASQWDLFWNPFSSLDVYSYTAWGSLDHTEMDNEITGLRQVQEEGIPGLDEVEGKKEDKEDEKVEMTEGTKIDSDCCREAVIVKDASETGSDTDAEHKVKGLQSHGAKNTEVSKAQNEELKVSNQETTVADQEAKKETPGFTVYVNQRPTSMTEVIKDLETQFIIICNSANEILKMSEASNAQNTTFSNELTGLKMLNPIALFYSVSSHSSRVFNNSSSFENVGYDSSSDFSEDSCMFSGSDQSTLDKLYAWEKKLYKEVKSGAQIRIAYEKKYMQLMNQKGKAEDPSVVHKTKAAIRDLHTQIKVSIHSIETVSKRIETLRDEELQPQLLELIQGLAKMWKVMAECHCTQKRTIDEAMLLLAPKLKEPKHTRIAAPSELLDRLVRSASQLETELRNWRACFESWISSQRSYVQALTGWLLRCICSDPETSKLLPLSPHRSGGTPPIFGICIQWFRFLDTISGKPVMDGLDFFANGVRLRSVVHAEKPCDEKLGWEWDCRQTLTESKRFAGEKLEVVEVSRSLGDSVVAEEMASGVVGMRVLCAGMSVAMSSITEFAVRSAEGYTELVKLWENVGNGGDREEEGIHPFTTESLSANSPPPL